MVKIRITEISQQKKNINRYNIFIDGEFAFGINDELRYKFGLKKDMELTDDFLNEILLEITKSDAINHALSYLSYRIRSEKEVRDYLIKKDYNDFTVDYVVDYCKDKKYIDDYNFAEIYMRDRLKLKKHGAYRIKQDLKSKGIADNIINEIVDLDSHDEYDMALDLAKKRLNSYKNDTRQAKYRKLSGYLQRRGYSYSVVSKVLGEVLNE